MDKVIEKELETIKRIDNALSREIENRIHGIDIKGKTIQQIIDELSLKKQVKSLGNFGTIHKGKGIPKKAVTEVGVPCVRYGELYTKHHRIIREFHSHISSETCSTAFQLEKHDVLFAGSGETITEIGKSAAFISDTAAYAGGDMLIFRPNDMDGAFLGYLMNSQLVRQQLNKYGTGATVVHVYKDDLKKIKIPNISRHEQIEIRKGLEMFALNIKNAEEKVSSSKFLQKSLINQVF